jgi:hypothetical protein
MSDRPLYPRLLRLRHIHPSGWQRAIFVEGSIAVASLLVLADVATAWTLAVLPLVVAAVVKANDVLAGALRQELPGGGEDPSAAELVEPLSER